MVESMAPEVVDTAEIRKTQGAFFTPDAISNLQPGYFIAEMVNRVIDATPVNLHRGARDRQKQAAASL